MTTPAALTPGSSPSSSTESRVIDRDDACRLGDVDLDARKQSVDLTERTTPRKRLRAETSRRSRLRAAARSRRRARRAGCLVALDADLARAVPAPERVERDAERPRSLGGGIVLPRHCLDILDCTGGGCPALRPGRLPRSRGAVAARRRGAAQPDPRARGNAPGPPARLSRVSALACGAGHGRGAALRTPPHNLVVARGSDDAVDALARAIDEPLPGVVGAVPEVDRFAAAWGAQAEPRVRQGIYALHAVVAPSRPAPGSLRAATRADRPLLLEWWRAFAVEALDRAPDQDPDRAERRPQARRGRRGIAPGRTGAARSRPSASAAQPRPASASGPSTHPPSSAAAGTRARSRPTSPRSSSPPGAASASSTPTSPTRPRTRSTSTSATSASATRSNTRSSRAGCCRACAWVSAVVTQASRQRGARYRRRACATHRARAVGTSGPT